MTLVIKRMSGPYRRTTTTESSSDSESGNFSTSSESWEKAWPSGSEKKVTPTLLTFLLVIAISLVCLTLYPDDDSDRYANVRMGTCASCFIFLSISICLFVFPNRPFTHPHHAVWQVVLGMSILYLLFLSIVFFQSYSDVKLFLKWIDHNLNGSAADGLTVYNDNCSISWKNMYRRVDIFVTGHFVGWLFKTMIIRHTGIVWSLSIMWELTELFFAHVLPNFKECWWDMLIFDILLSNALGIYVGTLVCQKLKVKSFYWQSVKVIKGRKGKMKRIVLQYTPQDWSKVRLLDPSSAHMRTLAIFSLILAFLVTELNGFLLKQVFFIPTDHFLTIGRLSFIVLIATPAVHQYYLYTTDNTCKRLGSQAWIFAAIVTLELLISLRFGAPILPRLSLLMVAAWLGVIALLSIIVMFNTWVKRYLFGWFWYFVTTLVPLNATRKMEKRKGDYI